ncbi:hypothetical protein BH10CYA1_BH10CYA1_64550 [soil metagenome]
MVEEVFGFLCLGRGVNMRYQSHIKLALPDASSKGFLPHLG